MSYRDLKIEHSYISRGDNNIADSFLNPVLKCTKEYKRSVGFFSSGVLETITDGALSLARNGGSIKLIASPKLSEEDVEAINLGYEQKNQKLSDAFTRDFVREVEKLNDMRLQLLCDLIRKGVLDIKIAITEDTGIYHDKLGVMKDFDGNTLVFYGSSNSSYAGYRSNYEKIRVSKGWEPGFQEIVADEELEFNNLWNGLNPFVKVQDYTKTAEENLIKIIKNRASAPKNTGIKLRDYQKEAIEAWVKNNYHGFYVMATGTGKTWTAIYSAKELVKTHPCMIVICAPYKHLVKQWSEDVQNAFPNARIILVSSENQGWDKQITNEIIRCKYESSTQLIIISTITSFKMQKFDDVIQKYKGDRLLIVDEAHRFTSRPEELHTTYKYMLGLSATPFSGTSAAIVLEAYLRRAELNDDGDRIVKYSHMATTILEEYKIRLQKDKIGIVAETMTVCYKKLANKKNLIDRIKMDPVSLDLKYLNADGEEVNKASLSAGEKQLMVISLLWALAICSKKKLPVIIDTPLSRLDSAHRVSLIQTYFPQASEQTIILSTDSEIDRNYYTIMKDDIGDEFTLVYDDSTKSTTIHRGYFREDA